MVPSSISVASSARPRLLDARCYSVVRLAEHTLRSFSDRHWWYETHEKEMDTFKILCGQFCYETLLQNTCCRSLHIISSKPERGLGLRRSRRHITRSGWARAQHAQCSQMFRGVSLNWHHTARSDPGCETKADTPTETQKKVRAAPATRLAMHKQTQKTTGFITKWPATQFVHWYLVHLLRNVRKFGEPKNNWFRTCPKIHKEAPHTGEKAPRQDTRLRPQFRASLRGRNPFRRWEVRPVRL